MPRSRRRRQNNTPANQNRSEIQLQQASIESFKGPLPRPADLERYNAVLPGAAERIMKMAERNQEHRQVLEKTAVLNEVDSGARGQKYGLVVAVTGIVAGTIVAVVGNVGFGVGLSGGTIGVIASAYFAGLYNRRKERQQRARWMTSRE